MRLAVVLAVLAAVPVLLVAFALALARGGFAAYAADVRGHGASGVKGRIAYVGQLEDDLEDLLAAAGPPRPRLLVGFSSGGGFVLRFAADPRQRDRSSSASKEAGRPVPVTMVPGTNHIGMTLQPAAIEAVVAAARRVAARTQAP